MISPTKQQTAFMVSRPQDLHAVPRQVAISLVDKIIVNSTELDTAVCVGCLALIMALSLYIGDFFSQNHHKTIPGTFR